MINNDEKKHLFIFIVVKMFSINGMKCSDYHVHPHIHEQRHMDHAYFFYTMQRNISK